MKTLKQLHRPLSNDFILIIAAVTMIFLSGFINPVKVKAQPDINYFSANPNRACPPPADVYFYAYVKGNYIIMGDIK